MLPHEFIDELNSLPPLDLSGIMKVGDRVRLTGKLLNPGSDWMPEEDLQPGLGGEIVHLMLEGPEEWHQISVRWDNGRSLGLFPKDPFIVIKE